jgi:hypothetical protein
MAWLVIPPQYHPPFLPFPSHVLCRRLQVCGPSSALRSTAARRNMATWTTIPGNDQCFPQRCCQRHVVPSFVTVPPPRASRANLPRAGRGAEASGDVMRRGIAKATLPQPASTKRDARASSAAVATAPSPCAVGQPRLRELNCGNHAGFNERHLRHHEQANCSHEQAAPYCSHEQAAPQCQSASGGASKWNGFLEQPRRQQTTSTKWGSFVSPAVPRAAGLDDPEDGFTTSFD